jgi:hypothetical protein
MGAKLTGVGFGTHTFTVPILAVLALGPNWRDIK